MADILTPEQVAVFRGWADMSPIVAAYALRTALAETLDSNEALREQLAKVRELREFNKKQLAEARAACTAASQSRASVVIALQEAEADVLALVKAFQSVYVNHSGREVRSTVLARPGVKRVMGERC